MKMTEAERLKLAVQLKILKELKLLNSKLDTLVPSSYASCSDAYNLSKPSHYDLTIEKAAAEAGIISI